jgi:uncharacterized protein YceH (UPF0502 family)
MRVRVRKEREGSTRENNFFHLLAGIHEAAICSVKREREREVGGGGEEEGKIGFCF